MLRADGDVESFPPGDQLPGATDPPEEPSPPEPPDPDLRDELDLAEFESLFAEWKRTKRPELRDRLIAMHMNLVRYLARKFRDRGEPLEDLVQQGTVGLINAVDRFDLDRGVKFSTYATPTIMGEIRRYFRDRSWSMKVPRRLQELNLLANRAIDSLTHELDRSPTIGEIAAAVQAPEEEVIEALEMAQAYELVSLDAEIGRAGEDRGTALHEILGREDEQLAAIPERQEIRDAMRVLDERELRVIHYAYYDQLSQTQIAKILGISQMHVSRVQRKAIAKMKEYLRVRSR